jgi:[glutamine synthetase] adenylyltransferase / [glutamine synthetase]-adenylyl-L-tyrosine phosphorylase
MQIHNHIRPIKPANTFPKEFIDAFEEKWAAFIHACDKENIVVPDGHELLKAIKNVFVFSEFIAKRCIVNPKVLCDLMDSGDLKRRYEVDAYEKKIKAECASVADVATLSVVIRKIRTREMVRIAFRDLAGWSDLSETMSDLSAFADACLEISLTLLYQWLCKEYGTPTGSDGAAHQLIVIGLGKLGGRELNFSSDIDLMFAFPGSGYAEVLGKSITNEEFFTRLCRRLVEVIGKNMADGFVFRVDTRLRPYGDSGPIAMSFDAMEQYYQYQGREWERYAFIKARIVAGDKKKGRSLLERLRPFVYRRYLDYGTFESLREMKQKIEIEVTRQGMEENIKLGSGGIREVEFFGQIFQLIRGGVNADYQKRSILDILQVMTKDNCVPKEVCDQLTDAYVFLRNVENRLQMATDLQTHSLPDKASHRGRLAFSMGFVDWQPFIEALNVHMRNVHHHFQQLLETDDLEDLADDQLKLANDVWLHLSDTAVCLQLIESMGFHEPAQVMAILENYKKITESHDVSPQGRNRLNRLAPHILKASLLSENSVLVLKRIFELIKSVRRRSCYMALLVENTDALTHLVQLGSASPWIISFLSRHPLLLDELLDSRSLYAPLGKEDLTKELQQRFDRLPDSDLESQMDDVRIFKQINMLRISAADVGGLLPLMKVSDQLTFLAETILDRVLEVSWAQMVDKYGHPSGDIDPVQKGFGIIAYGKLGGLELGYGSDLDLVFLHTGSKGITKGGQLASVDNAQFYMRLGQRIIHFLTTMTQTGKLYEADMRLRPSGSAGILVSHIDAFEDYQLNRAWIWEHQALIKARSVSGDVGVGERFLKIRETVLSISRDKKKLRKAILDMREKMRVAHGKSKAGVFDLKHDAGGIIDIEFLVQFLILLNASRFSELLKWTDVVRQLNSLALSGIIDDRTAYMLKQAYLVFRYYVHRLALQEKPASLTNSRFTDLRDEIRRIWDKFL